MQHERRAGLDYRLRRGRSQQIAYHAHLRSDTRGLSLTQKRKATALCDDALDLLDKAIAQALANVKPAHRPVR